MPQLSQKKFLVFFSFVLLAFLFGRLYNESFFLNDSYEYIKTTELLKSGEYFHSTQDINKAELLSKRGATYPLFLMILSSLPFNWIVVLQTLFGFLNVLLVTKIFKKMGGRNYFLLGTLFLLTPSFFIYNNLIMTEFLALTIIFFIFYLFLDYTKNGYVLYIQILLTLLIFLKPVFYFFSVINFLFFIYLSFRYKKGYYLTALIPFICVISFMYFNQVRTGYFHFSSMQNINLIDYNIYLHKSKNEGSANADLWKESIYDKADKYNSFKDRNEYLNDVGKQYIKENFISYSIFHLYGAVRGSMDPGRFDLMTFSNSVYNSNEGLLSVLSEKDITMALKNFFKNKNSWIIFLLALILIGNFLKWLLFFKYVFLKWKKSNFGIVYVIILMFYYILLTGPVNASRYMVAIQGIIIVLASLTFKKESASQKFVL